MTVTPREITLGNRRIDLVRGEVSGSEGSHERGTSLTEKEAALLAYLAANAGRPVPRNELYREVWGHQNALRTRTLDVTVRRLREKIETDPASPRWILTIQGVGYRLEPTESSPTGVAPSADSTDPDAAALDTGRTNVGPESSSFVGRARSLAEIERHFAAGSRLVTVMGPPGMGKTRIARRFARSVLRPGSGFDGAWFADLTEARDRDDVVAAVAAAFGVSLPDVRSAEEATTRTGRAIAARGPVLVVLDNFEQVTEHASATAGAWLDLAPRARFLVTSRHRLGLAAEQTWELAPLLEDDAVRLYVERAQAVRRDFRLAGVDDRAHVARIADVVDRIPLAIELAAARASVLTPRETLDRLARRFQVLGTTRHGLTPRQATLRGAIDWSWDLLDEPERDLLARFSVFRGGFALAAAEAIARPDAPRAALDVLDSLVAKSLVRAGEAPDAPGVLRFGMYESIREYASERLDERRARAEVEAAHARWYLSEGERLAAVSGPGVPAAMADLFRESDNLAAVHRTALDRDPSLAVRAALVLDPMLELRGPISLRLPLLEAAVGAAERAGDPTLLAPALLARGTAIRVAARYARATEDLERARAIALAARMPAVEAAALQQLGIIVRIRGDPAASRKWFEDALAIRRRAGLPRGESAAISQYAATFQDEGDAPRARRELLEALAAARREGDLREEAHALHSLGNLDISLGRPNDARDHHQRALALYQAMGDRRFEGSTLNNLAIVEQMDGRLDAARPLLESAIARAREAGDRRSEGIARGALASVDASLGRLGEAGSGFEAALTIHRECENRRFEAVTLTLIGRNHAEEGNLDAARGAWEEARRLHGAVANRRFEGLTDVYLGALSLVEGDAEAALVATGRGTAIAREVGHRNLLGAALGWLGAALALLDRIDEAERVFEEAHAALSEGAEPGTAWTAQALATLVSVARARSAEREGRASDARALRTAAAAALDAICEDPDGLPDRTTRSQDLRIAVAFVKRELGA